jgi:hypothetical protein
MPTYLFITLIPPILAFVAIILLPRRGEHRSLWLQAFAKVMGFSFYHRVDPDFADKLRNFSIFGRNRRVGMTGMAGMTGNYYAFT